SAPLIRDGRLRGIMLESSYPDGREPGQLFGHLTPEWLMKELRRLARLVDANQPQRALTGLKVAVTHIKPSLEKGKPPRQLVEEQLRQHNDLGVEFVFPGQGQRLDF
ncbi:MAG: 3',5'-cyclic-nucleotide phosphodiesterase, partial [Candidatus Eremiobacteraeota bacterium]|nr:3',5'-cyclic-nucleotide phosphodiesterase [Candidatus Eremiobacteraeota bacterium]